MTSQADVATADSAAFDAIVIGAGYRTLALA
jgi:hypothetical protein